MDIRDLEKELDSVLDNHASTTQRYMYSFHHLGEEEQQATIGGTLEEMNREHNKALQGFKESIIEYLKDNQ